MNPYTRRFEIVELVGGWGVAIAPHGEIVGAYETLLDANVALLEFEQGLDEPAKYWIVDSFVCEPGLGNQLGELPEFDLEGATCLTMTQAQFDHLCELYFKEYGHYPHT